MTSQKVEAVRTWTGVEAVRTGAKAVRSCVKAERSTSVEAMVAEIYESNLISKEIQEVIRRSKFIV